MCVSGGGSGDEAGGGVKKDLQLMEGFVEVQDVEERRSNQAGLAPPH